jgi:hypothetical protein
MSAKTTLRRLLAAGETERVVEALQGIAGRFGDKHFANDVLHQAGRFSSLQKDRLNGVISDEFYNIQLNNIRQALQNLIDRTPEDAVMDEPALPDKPVQFKPDAPVSAEPASEKTTSPKVSSHVPWIVGLVLLLSSFVALIGFVPCPTAAQETVFRLLMALGAGGIGSVLPGMFQFEGAAVKAGGAVGVFALVYLVNPAGVVKNDNRCNRAPFEFTVSLQPDKNLTLSPQYPKLENAALQLRLDNKWEPAEVDAAGDADYKSIPGDFKDRKVAARLEANHWKLTQDSVTLSGKSGELTIVPDGSLGRITGKAFRTSDNAPLSGIVIEVEGERTLTDDLGNFNLDIPLEKQKAEYTLLAVKDGISSQTRKAVAGENVEVGFR